MHRDQSALMVIVRLVVVVASCTKVQLQYAKPITNSNARSANQEMVGIVGILGIGSFVQVIIKDEHSHHDRLSRTCSHLESCPWQHESIVI